MPVNIFTYGSLMFPQVWRRVVRGRYRCAPADIAGYARYALADETYPGLVAQAGGRVRGVVYFDVAPADVAALDLFEGTQYRRDWLDATLDSGDTVTVGAYIFLASQRLSALPWQPEAFQLAHFLETYCRDKLGG